MSSVTRVRDPASQDPGSQSQPLLSGIQGAANPETSTPPNPSRQAPVLHCSSRSRKQRGNTGRPRPVSGLWIRRSTTPPLISDLSAPPRPAPLLPRALSAPPCLRSPRLAVRTGPRQLLPSTRPPPPVGRHQAGTAASVASEFG